MRAFVIRLFILLGLIFPGIASAVTPAPSFGTMSPVDFYSFVKNVAGPAPVTVNWTQPAGVVVNHVAIDYIYNCVAGSLPFTVQALPVAGSTTVNVPWFTSNVGLGCPENTNPPSAAVIKLAYQVNGGGPVYVVSQPYTPSALQPSFGTMSPVDFATFLSGAATSNRSVVVNWTQPAGVVVNNVSINYIYSCAAGSLPFTVQAVPVAGATTATVPWFASKVGLGCPENTNPPTSAVINLAYQVNGAGPLLVISLPYTSAISQSVPFTGGTSNVTLSGGALNPKDVVGAWYGTNMGSGKTSVIFTFTDNGNYYLAEDATTPPAIPNVLAPSGMEFGTQTWDPATGIMAYSTQFDTNGQGGMSSTGPIPSSGTLPVSVVGDTLFIGGGNQSLRRVIDFAKPIVGSWYIGVPGSDRIFTFMSDGSYLSAGNENPALSPGGMRGMERGTYTWNVVTGAFTHATSLTSGTGGLSNVVCNSMQITGNTMNGTCTEPSGLVVTYLFTRVASATVAISKVAQTLSFGVAPTVIVGGTGTVSATGGASGNPVTFSSITSGVCSVTGSTVTGLAIGTCTIAADQAGNASYNAAPQVTQNITVNAVGAVLNPALSLNLVVSWNLLGNSVNAPLTVSTTFSNAAYVATVWKWIPATSRWAFYTPTLADGGAAYAATKGYDFLTVINGGEGFWVNAKVAFSTQLPAGNAIGTSAFADQLLPPNRLPLGWSLIAVGDNPLPRNFANAIALTPPATPNVAATSLTTLWAWDGTLTNWYFYAPSLDNSGGLATYIASKSYLNFGTKTLAPGMGLWVNHP